MNNSRALSREAKTLIADPENVVFVSAVSLWEIWLKTSLGKLDIPANFEQAVANESFQSLPLAAKHTKRIA